MVILNLSLKPCCAASLLYKHQLETSWFRTCIAAAPVCTVARLLRIRIAATPKHTASSLFRIYIYIHIYIYVCMYVCMYIYIYIYIYAVCWKRDCFQSSAQKHARGGELRGFRGVQSVHQQGEISEVMSALLLPCLNVGPSCVIVMFECWA
jgi:hypothetical protein